MHTFAFLRGIPACGAFVAPARAAARPALAVCALWTLLTASPASAVTMIDIHSPGQNIVNLAFRADEMDNMMVERFGCEFSEYSKSEA